MGTSASKAIAEVGVRSKMLNMNPDEEGGDEFWRMVSNMAGEGEQLTDRDAEMGGSNFMSNFISDAQLASNNMDTAIGFDMDGLLNNPELSGDSVI